MSTYEGENAILDLIDRIAEHPQEPIVTRDINKVANLEFFPTVFVVERQDDVIKTSGAQTPVNSRRLFVSVVSFIEGTSGEAAPAELTTFQRSLRRVIYSSETPPSIGDYGAYFQEHAASQVVYPPLGNNVIAQEIVLKIIYKEQVARLFVAPTV